MSCKFIIRGVVSVIQICAPLSGRRHVPKQVDGTCVRVFNKKIRFILSINLINLAEIWRGGRNSAKRHNHLIQLVLRLVCVHISAPVPSLSRPISQNNDAHSRKITGNDLQAHKINPAYICFIIFFFVYNYKLCTIYKFRGTDEIVAVKNICILT